LRLGRRVRLCKGCTFFAVGGGLGLVAGALMNPTLGQAAGLVAAAVGTVVLALVRRLPKLLGRLVPGAALGMAAWAGWPSLLGVCFSVAVLGLLYRGRGVDRKRCEFCNERERQPCSGFIAIVRRERAFQRQANAWLRAADRKDRM